MPIGRGVSSLLDDIPILISPWQEGLALDSFLLISETPNLNKKLLLDKMALGFG
jgi:hypothetical protein